MNFTDDEVVELRDRLSREKAVELTPFTLYVLVSMVIGLIGNVLVVVFYGRKSRMTPTTRLIVAVAVIDTIICILMPKNIVDVLFTYKFTSSALCKLNIYVNHATTASSVIVLVAIAVFRFRAVCRPFERQFTTRHANLSIVFAVVFSLLLSIPVLFTFESVSLNVTVMTGTKIVVHDCSITKKSSLKGLIVAVNTIYFFVLVGTTITFVVLYGIMGCAILNYHKTKKVITGKSLHVIKSLRSEEQTDSFDNRGHESSTTITFEHGADKGNELTATSSTSIEVSHKQNQIMKPIKQQRFDTSDINIEDLLKPMISIEFGPTIEDGQTDIGCYRGVAVVSSNKDQCNETNPTGVYQSQTDNLNNKLNVSKHGVNTHDHDSDKENQTPVSKSGKVNDDQKNHLSTVVIKQTMMLFIITVIFVISFLPYFMLSLSRVLSKDNVPEFSNWVKFCGRSYLINSVTNPFIYGLFNSEFRRFVKETLCRCCGK